MEYPLVLRFSLPVSSTSVFFRIEQKADSPEPPTVDEVARAVDELTGQDYCKGAVAKNGFQPTEEVSPTQNKSEFQDFISDKLSDPLVAEDFAQKMGLKQPCTAARALPLDIQLFVFWQTEAIAESYRLASTANVKFSKPEVITETLEKEFQVSEESEKNIGYYIYLRPYIPFNSQFHFEWIGNVVDDEKNIKRGPTSISIKNKAIISWGKKVSGTFKVKFKTKYHAVTATIKPRAGDYSATVYGVWSGTPVKLSLVVPEKTDDEDCPVKKLLEGTGDLSDVAISGENDDKEASEITCFWRTTHELRKPCGDNDLIDRWETIDRVKCPDDIADRTTTLNSPMSLGYIEEIESRYYYEVGRRTIPEYITTSDPRFDHDCQECSNEGFKEACCRERDSVGGILEPIPPCLEIKSTFYGGVEIEKGRDYWKDKYPGGVTFQPKLPRDGFCGVKKVIFNIDSCCSRATDIVYDDIRSPDVIAEGWQATIYWQGGLAPYTVELSGTGFYLSKDNDIQTAETSGKSITIYARGSCGTCDIDISDSCQNSDTGFIRSTNGYWVTISDTTQDDPNTWSMCIKGKYRYWDDWCRKGPPSTCTGTGTQYCPKPSSFPDDWNDIEGNLIEEWGC